MPSPSTARKSSNEKVRAHRARLRRKGLRPIQIWLPDTRSAEFKKAAHKQSLAVTRSRSARDDQSFIDSVSDWGQD